MTLPKLSEEAIRSAVSSSSYSRGIPYYKSGAVKDLVAYQNQLLAKVQGSDDEPYTVEVFLDETGVQSANCSCPYSYGDYCKHIAAVLLAYQAQYEQLASRPGLDTLLAPLNRDQLQQLLFRLVQVDPNLIRQIEEELPMVIKPPETAAVSRPELHLDLLKDQIHRDMRHLKQLGYDSYGDERIPQFGESLNPAIKQAEQFLAAGDVSAALLILETAFESWITHFQKLDVYVQDLLSETDQPALDKFATTLVEALLQKELSPAGRNHWQKQIENWQEEIVIGDTLDLLESVVAQGWDHPPLQKILQGHLNQDIWENEEPPSYANHLAYLRLKILEQQGRNQEYLYLAQAEHQYQQYLLKLVELGQIDLALSEGYKWLDNPDEALAVAQKMQNQGHTTQAIAIAEHGLTLDRPEEQWQLAPWLRDLAIQEQHDALAKKAAKATFASTTSLKDYQIARQLLALEWDVQKADYLKILDKTTYSSSKADIYLLEGMLVEAMATVDKRYSYDFNQIKRVIEATTDKYPAWAMKHCQQEAEKIMNAAKAGEYHIAQDWLILAKTVYLFHGQQKEWQQYLDNLLVTHGRKRNLVPLLKSIR